MSEKAPVNNIEQCDPNTLGLARKPRPSIKRKPETEVVVQMGPFTDGQITAPELVRPLEGPTEWLIKPKTGEIVPLEAGSPPEKNTIRKYITVNAQDTDVPNDLPKISEGYVVERVTPSPLPSMDTPARENGQDTVRIIEKDGPAKVECNPVNNNPPVAPSDTPPVGDENSGGGENGGGECHTPACETPVDARNDHAETEENCPITVDVLKNDLGCGELTIKEAHAQHGNVEIKDGKLLYTPHDGFTGNDVITYTIGDESCLTDTANVYMKVEHGSHTGENSASGGYSSGSVIIEPPSLSPEAQGQSATSRTHVNDHEFSSEPYNNGDILVGEHSSDNVIFSDDMVAHQSGNQSDWSMAAESSAMMSSAIAIQAPEDLPVAA